jgi:HEPN domain-containing protein
MSLENLVTIHRLVTHTPTKESTAKLLQAALRNLADAKVKSISNENRFDAAYKAVIQAAMAALWANGYRTATNEPGHHITAIQTLLKTIGLDTETMILLNALRKQRNMSDYAGDSISDGTLAECIAQAEGVYNMVLEWIKTHRGDLID